MAKQIMDCFENQMNAYVWWYLVTEFCNLMNASGTWTNKGYIMAQFSKFIRPGAHRASAPYEPQQNVNVQAFSGEEYNVIIALNRNNAPSTQSFTVTKGSFSDVHRYTTSDSKKMSDEGTVTITDHSFTAVLDPRSITTFVAEGTAP